MSTLRSKKEAAVPPAGEPGPTITHLVAKEIGNRIIDGVYRPGMSLREIPLSEELGVSRGSIREALRVLERDGVVKIEAHKGASVTQLSTDELIEIYQVRGVLLGLALAIASERCDETDIKWLQGKLGKLKRDLQQPDALAGASHAATSAEMASYLIECSGNRRLKFLLTQMSAQIARYTRVGLATAERRASSFETWTAVFEALKAHDAAAAERLGRKLVSDTLHFALTRIAGLV